MSGDRGSKESRARVQRAAKTRSRVARTAKSRSEELSPERRVELAQQIEANRWRGKPPSI
jgi:hypothetical protein